MKPGDVVRLKSGGPAMTILVPVEHWTEDNHQKYSKTHVEVAWINAQGHMLREILPLAALEPCST